MAIVYSLFFDFGNCHMFSSTEIIFNHGAEFWTKYVAEPSRCGSLSVFRNFGFIG
jgi:hypothetical protein